LAAGRTKFIVGGVLILAAVVYLIVSSTAANAQYFMTIDEVVLERETVMGRELRVSGAVLGETIDYVPETLTLRFEVAHVPGDLGDIETEGGLAEALYIAVNDPTRSRLQIEYIGPKPDLLRGEAQAIMTGKLGDDGVFYANELLLKCPTRYEEFDPEAAEG
jgi:cytochrome c-type biogenesis protein CcmE